MATTLTFKGVLETGASFLRVSIVIMGIVAFLVGLGYSIIEGGSSSSFLVGALLIFLAMGIQIAGIIGLSQKLISDAFLEGFKAAKEDGSVGDGTRMDTKETLTSGTRVIGVIVLTFIVAFILFTTGWDMLSPEEYTEEMASKVEVLLGSLFIGAGCAVVLSAMLGLIARVIAEGVSFGASNTGVTFVTDSEIEFSPSEPTEPWSDSTKRLAASTLVIFLGFVLRWKSYWEDDWEDGWYRIYTPTGFDELSEFRLFDAIPEILESINNQDYPILGGINLILYELLPYVFLATFSLAWYKHSQGDDEFVRRVGIFHVGFFIIYVLTLIKPILDEDWRANEISSFTRIFSDRAGVWAAGLAGLGLIPEFTQRFSSSETKSSDDRFDELDADGDGVLSREELEAADEFDEGAFEEMDTDGDGEISQEEFDDFDDFDV